MSAPSGVTRFCLGMAGLIRDSGKAQSQREATEASSRTPSTTPVVRRARSVSSARRSDVPPNAHSAAVVATTTAITRIARPSVSEESLACANALTRASAKIQAFGLTNWKSAARGMPKGRLHHCVAERHAPGEPNSQVDEVCRGERFQTQFHVGERLDQPSSPTAAIPTSIAIPTAVPTTCGNVRRNPKVTPDASSSVLFGPGEPEPTATKVMSAIASFSPIGSFAPPAERTMDRRGSLVRLADAFDDAGRVGPRVEAPPAPGISEVFHARFVRHAYPRHTHEDWTVFVVDDGGVLWYDLDKRARGVGTSVVTVLPPHVVHDGRPSSDDGFRKRVLYVETRGAWVTPHRARGRRAGHPLDRASLGALHRLHRALERPEDLLEAESLMGIVGERLRSRLGESPARASSLPDAAIAGALRDLLDAHLPERPTLADAAATIGTSTPALVRAFSRTFGIAPHQYVIGRRIEHARKRLLAGEPPAFAAVGAGFHDQAHLTRLFRRHVGETPARFAASGLQSESGARGESNPHVLYDTGT